MPLHIRKHSKVVMLDEVEVVMTDLNRTVTLDWTDLDLSEATSARAKAAILDITLHPDTVGATGYFMVYLRRKGASGPHYFIGALYPDMATAGMWFQFMVLCKLDGNQTMQYKLERQAGAWQVDTYLKVHGYIE